MQAAYKSKSLKELLAQQGTVEQPEVGEPLTDAHACSQTLNDGSKSFHAAARLLPNAFARDATALYAFCRLSDDLIDNAHEADAQQVMQTLYHRLDQLYAGRPYPHAADRALLDVIQRHQLPKPLLLSLFEGFEWDARGRDYETLEDIYAYGARVAGTVGVMMSVLMGAREPNMIARAADLGVAMQLTNIARDVGEDARAGRLYLPRQWLRDAGIDPEQFLATPVFSPALKAVVSRLLNAADELYARADSGIALLPRGVRPGMYAARLLYSEIGNEIRRLDCNSVDQRAVVSSLAKARVLTRLAKLPFLGSRHLPQAALAETEYLVDIITQQASTSQLASQPPAKGITSKAVWVLDLFDELHKRDADLLAMRNKAKAH